MQIDIKQDHIQTAPGLHQTFVKRWSAVVRFALIWAILGSVVGVIWTLPSTTAMIASQGYLAWLLRSIVPVFATAFILIVAVGVSVDSGEEMARRPLWFLFVLALGSAVATAVTWVINLVLPSGNFFCVGSWLLNVWLTIMLFGCAFGWPAVLNVKRAAEQRALAQLLMKRSLLARNVARAGLFAARAQVDPELVARVLAQVRHRYSVDAQSAAELLDQLIAFLRLAMNRKGGQQVLLGSEIDMMRGYAALRQIETGKKIDLHISLEQEGQRQQLTAMPLFLLVRHVLRCVPATSVRTLTLHIKISLDSMHLLLVTGMTPLDLDVLHGLRTDFSETLAGAQEVDILHEQSDKGEHQYVVQAAIG